MSHVDVDAVNRRFEALFDEGVDPREAFNALFEAVPLGVALMTAAGIIVEVNSHVQQSLGYERSDLIGRSIFDITAPEDVSPHRELIEQLLRNEISRFRIEKRAIRKDGSVAWMQLTVASLDFGNSRQRYIISMSEDITESRLAEERLRESEERFRVLIDGVREYALFLVDTNGMITSWNPGMERVLGWSEDEIVGKHVRVIFTPEDQKAGIPEQEMEIAAREGVASDERWHIRKDGARFYAIGAVHPLYDDRGKVRGYSKVLGDFTGRHETEQWMQRQASLLDLSLDAILVQEPIDNRIIYWSRGAERTYGWTRDEAEGKIAYELLKTEFPLPRSSLVAALQKDGCWDGDLVHTCKDGRRITVASRWALETDGEAGGLRSVLEVNRDVTEQRRIAEEQRAFAANQKRIADALQKSLLMAPPPDIHPGLSIKALYQAAQDDILVGGDFFDIFAVAQNKVAVVIGDATGKGLEAATYTAEIKFVLRAFLREFGSPAVALQRVNAFICDKEQLDPMHIGQSYMAVAAVLIDTLTGQVSAAMAGMEPPILLRASGENVEFSHGGPLLGVTENPEYGVDEHMMADGDIIAMSTDGITEARHPERRLDFFGSCGLAHSIRTHNNGRTSLAEIAGAVVRDAREFSGGPIRDDVCLLLVKRNP